MKVRNLIRLMKEMAGIWYGHGAVTGSFDIQPNQALLPLPEN